jgi:RNA polymerase sigma factor for flagellar operon FliA
MTLETPLSDPQKLMESFLANRDSALREELVLRFVPLVHYVLGRLGFTQEMGTDYEDMVSQGLLGLIEAVDHYNPSFGTQFRTYAVVRVRGKILDYLRTLDWLSRTERRRSRAVQKAIADFWLQNQRSPSENEIAQQLNIAVDQVQKALVDSSRVIVSLDASLEAEEDENQSLHETISDDTQPDPSEVLFQEETLAQLTKAIKNLDQREQLVLSLYYYEKLTFKEIGQVLNLTESRICQLHARAITVLRTDLNRDEMPEPTVPVRKVKTAYLVNQNQTAVDRRG